MHPIYHRFAIQTHHPSSSFNGHHYHFKAPAPRPHQLHAISDLSFFPEMGTGHSLPETHTFNVFTSSLTISAIIQLQILLFRSVFVVRAFNSILIITSCPLLRSGCCWPRISSASSSSSYRSGSLRRQLPKESYRSSPVQWCRCLLILPDFRDCPSTVLPNGDASSSSSFAPQSEFTDRPLIIIPRLQL